VIGYVVGVGMPDVIWFKDGIPAGAVGRVPVKEGTAEVTEEPVAGCETAGADEAPVEAGAEEAPVDAGIALVAGEEDEALPELATAAFGS